jgi:ribonuclease P protein component
VDWIAYHRSFFPGCEAKMTNLVENWRISLCKPLYLPTMNQTFGKKYKLCRQKVMDALFKEGTSLKQYPYVLHYLEVDEKLEAPFQITISAPKRIFKKAHDRNRVKRLMRETIRKNKLILETFLNERNGQLALFMIYTAKEVLPYEVLFKKTELLFMQLVKQMKNHEDIKIEK